MTTIDRGTYEMLWDCPSCDTRKLLGLTHRFCPNCGAPQDPTLRYFPPQAEAVAVENHPLVGPDWRCSGCDAPNSNRAAFCGACGAPRSGEGEVARRRDVVSASGAAFQGETSADAKKDRQAPPAPTAPPAAPPAKKRRIPVKAIGCGCAVLVVVALALAVAGLFAANTFLAKDTVVQVTARTWERTIDVQDYKEVSDSSWCDAMPSGAYGVSRRQEQRSTRKIADGETCSDRRVDHGDGTFGVKTECVTKYREEPVFADKCTYRIKRWTSAGAAKANGTGAQAPAWPQVATSATRREGSRHETYEVRLVEPGGRSHTCSFSQAEWGQKVEGTRWRSKVGLVLKDIDCDELQPAR